MLSLPPRRLEYHEIRTPQYNQGTGKKIESDEILKTASLHVKVNQTFPNSQFTKLFAR